MLVKLINILGSGAFADVYLAKARGIEVAYKKPNNELSKKESIKAALREVEILKYFKKSKYILNMLDFKINDNQNYIITELLGDELYTLIKHYRKIKSIIPLTVVKRLCLQILNGLAELKQKNVFHNDLKPENILFTTPLDKIFKVKKHIFTKSVIENKDIIKMPITLKFFHKIHFEKYYYVLMELSLLKISIKITDLGGSFNRKMAVEYKKDFEYSRPTRYYISPERLLKAPVWIEADMWSFGCIVFELLILDVLFTPYRNNNMGINSAHVALIYNMFGPFPSDLLSHGKRSSRYFIDDVYKFQYLIGINYNSNYSIKSLLLRNGIQKKDIADIMNFLLPIMRIDAKKRITPRECIKADWLKNNKVFEVFN